MKTNQHHGGLAARLGLALVASSLLFLPATGQESSRRPAPPQATDARPAAQVRTDEEYERLIHRLEMGMSALEELGRRDALQAMRRITDEVRREREVAKRRGAQQQIDINLESLEQRIEIVRVALAALREANKQDGAEMMQRFLHTAELQHSGAEDAAILQAFEGLKQGTLVELLRVAARLHAGQGNERKARACGALAEFYTKRWNLTAAPRPEPPRAEQPGAWNLEDRAQRVKILHFVREAHVKAGWETAAEQLGRMIRIGELQLAGESLQEHNQLAEGLSMELITEHARRAAGMYREWGVTDRARLCAALAQFYTEHHLQQEGEEAGQAAPERRKEPERRAAPDRGVDGRPDAVRERTDAVQAQMRELGIRLERLQKELQEVQAQLRKLNPDRARDTR